MNGEYASYIVAIFSSYPGRGLISRWLECIWRPSPTYTYTIGVKVSNLVFLKSALANVALLRGAFFLLFTLGSRRQPDCFGLAWIDGSVLW